MPVQSCVRLLVYVLSFRVHNNKVQSSAIVKRQNAYLFTGDNDEDSTRSVSGRGSHARGE